MLKNLMILFSAALLFIGCSTKEMQKDIVYIEQECPKPTIDMTKFDESKPVKVRVHKGDFVVTIKKDDYLKMKKINESIKEKYKKLRLWIGTNIKNELIKNEIDSKEPG
ncbi:hypothetical protein [Poseidonibacter lekithochrous]|uniref:hypothetical protein n=1 Tax=Poseidonibacter lekithochrous TaxID=1904463 RepID=UPI000D3462BB|nr:hypothetical protein [Poseidonibacter lekithochrous]